MATDIERLTVLIEANTKSYERAMARIEQKTTAAIRASTRSVSSLDKQLKATMATARSFATAFGAGFLAGGLSQIPGVIREVVASTADMVDAADNIGITAERLQELRFAAEQAGIGAGELDSAMLQFSRRMAEAATGSGDLAKILAANGVALRDAQGNLRSLNELLDEYATLVANAASDQDRLLLAQAAFGRGGVAMVNMLRDGADGLANMSQQARDASAVLSEDLARSAADVDDQFTALSNTLSTTFKTAVLGAFSLAESLSDALDRMGQAAANALGLAEQRARAKVWSAGMTNTTTGYNPADWDWVQEMRGNAAVPKVVIPGKPTPRTTGSSAGGASRVASEAERAADAITREREAVDELIASLEQERALVGATTTEQRLYNELKHAGANATDAQVAAIERIVPQLIAEEEAYDRLVDRMDEVRDTAADSLSAFTSELRSGSSAAEALNSSLQRIFDSLIRLSEERAIAALFGAGGTTAPGLLGALFGGARAQGGPVVPGKFYKVGERGPELFAPRAPGNIIPNREMGGRTQVEARVRIDPSPLFITSVESRISSAVGSNNKRMMGVLADQQARYG